MTTRLVQGPIQRSFCFFPKAESVGFERLIQVAFTNQLEFRRNVVGHLAGKKHEHEIFPPHIRNILWGIYLQYAPR